MSCNRHPTEWARYKGHLDLAHLGQTEKARAVLEQVVNLYPKTEPAALATKRLETP